MRANQSCAFISEYSPAQPIRAWLITPLTNGAGGVGWNCGGWEGKGFYLEGALNNGAWDNVVE